MRGGEGVERGGETGLLTKYSPMPGITFRPFRAVLPSRCSSPLSILIL